MTIKSVFNFIFRNLDVLIYFAIHTFSISEKAGTEHTSRCPVPALLIQSKDTTASATVFSISSRFMVIYLLESSVHKGEGDRLAGKGSHCRCETYPPSIRTVPLPFQGRTKQYIILCSPSGRTTMVQWNSRTWISRSRLWSSQVFRPRSSSTRWTIWRGF